MFGVKKHGLEPMPNDSFTFSKNLSVHTKGRSLPNFLRPTVTLHVACPTAAEIPQSIDVVLWGAAGRGRKVRKPHSPGEVLAMKSEIQYILCGLNCLIMS